MATSLQPSDPLFAWRAVHHAVRMTDANELQRWIVVSDELTATAQLLSHGAALIGEFVFIHRDTHALTAVLATGVEKLLKLTYGFTVTAQQGSWPGATIRNYGHRVADLDKECRRLLRSRLEYATSSKYVTQLLDDVDNDSLIEPMLNLLQRYATTGRFYNLDHLGDAPQPEPSPQTHWESLSNSIGMPEQLVDGQLSIAELDEYDKYRQSFLRQSLWKWQELYWRSWIHGVCGPEAKRYGFELMPQRS